MAASLYSAMCRNSESALTKDYLDWLHHDANLTAHDSSVFGLIKEVSENLPLYGTPVPSAAILEFGKLYKLHDHLTIYGPAPGQPGYQWQAPNLDLSRS